MRLHAARGDSAGVVRVYQMCAAVLQRELHVAEDRVVYAHTGEDRVGVALKRLAVQVIFPRGWQ